VEMSLSAKLHFFLDHTVSDLDIMVSDLVASSSKRISHRSSTAPPEVSRHFSSLPILRVVRYKENPAQFMCNDHHQLRILLSYERVLCSSYLLQTRL
jgi:hypothetical protein